MDEQSIQKHGREQVSVRRRRRSAEEESRRIPTDTISQNTGSSLRTPGATKHVKPDTTYSLRWVLKSFICVAVLMVLTVISYILWTKYLVYSYDIPKRVIDEIGIEGVNIFQNYDSDEDGYLSLDEFIPLAHSFIKNYNITLANEYELVIDDSDEMVTVKAYFIPLQLDSLSENRDEITGYSKRDHLIGLKSWNRAVMTWQNFGVSHFRSFFPTNIDYHIANLGESYHILKFSSSLFSNPVLSSSRFYPPKVNEEHIILHKLLNMFHSHPFITSRFPPQGSVACVRAYNNEFVDIYFRIHAEFQLNEAPYYPFWFTPGQFTGNLIISRDAKRILYFRMFVPNQKKLNVDLEWLTGPDGSMEVDIGFLPLMELNITSPSVSIHDREPYFKELELPEDGSMSAIVDNIVWKKEISKEDALRSLEVTLYPFKEDLVKQEPSDPQVASIAKDFLDNYSFPVMMFISLPNGTIVHKVNANEFLDMESSLLDSGINFSRQNQLTKRKRKITRLVQKNSTSSTSRVKNVKIQLKEETSLIENISKLTSGLNYAQRLNDPASHNYVQFLNKGLKNAEIHKL